MIRLYRVGAGLPLLTCANAVCLNRVYPLTCTVGGRSAARPIRGSAL